MGQTTSTGLRNGFARANAELVQAYMASGMSQGDAQALAGQAVFTRSYLRLEQPIVAGQTVLNFPILNNQTGSGQSVRSTEVRLNQQDTFFTTDVAFYITNATSAAATGFQLFTYPNAVTFGTAATGLSLFNLYNGNLQISINNSIIVPKYPMTNFYKVYQTQLTAATNSPIDQFDPADVALWEPMVNFVGTKNSVITVNMPGAVTPAGGQFLFGVFIFHGILAQNSTLMS